MLPRIDASLTLRCECLQAVNEGPAATDSTVMCLQAVNEGPAMILYLGTTDADEAKSRAHNLLGALAASAKAAAAAGRQDDIAFLYGWRGDGIMGRVLEFAKVEAGAVSCDGLILLNVPEQAVFR